jgi:SAM-dependent methyltransferase
MDLRESAEDAVRHPWELARADFFTRLIVEKPSSTPVTVLDIGAGDAFFAEHLLAQLPPQSAVTCVDPSYPESWLGTRHKSDGRTLVFCHEPPSDFFDWIVLLDVLEHVEDSLALLQRQVVPALKPCGRALISVPAWQSLFTNHDTQLGHLRRYSPQQLRDELDQAELLPCLSGGLFSSLLLPRSLEKLGELLRGHRAQPQSELSDHIHTEVGGWSLGKWPTSLIRTALHWDGAFGLQAARLSLHLPGLSTWAIAEKKK